MEVIPDANRWALTMEEPAPVTRSPPDAASQLRVSMMRIISGEPQGWVEALATPINRCPVMGFAPDRTKSDLAALPILQMLDFMESIVQYVTATSGVYPGLLIMRVRCGTMLPCCVLRRSMADDLQHRESHLDMRGSISLGETMGTSEHTKAEERAKKAVEVLLASAVSPPLPQDLIRTPADLLLALVRSVEGR
jgi:hypothetical protein